jgi:UDP-N-acetylmuramoylalanine--D-glutamate ligase
MIDLGVLKGSSFVVLGLARSGLATVRALKAAGIDCVAWDDNAASREAAAKIGVAVVEPVGRALPASRSFATSSFWPAPNRRRVSSASPAPTANRRQPP